MHGHPRLRHEHPIQGTRRQVACLSNLGNRERHGKATSHERLCTTDDAAICRILNYAARFLLERERTQESVCMCAHMSRIAEGYLLDNLGEQFINLIPPIRIQLRAPAFENSNPKETFSILRLTYCRCDVNRIWKVKRWNLTIRTSFCSQRHASQHITPRTLPYRRYGRVLAAVMAKVEPLWRNAAAGSGNTPATPSAISAVLNPTMKR